jgi:hemerythrin-like domain-containing protein
MNAIELLEREHREIDRLFDELEGAFDGDRAYDDILAQLKLTLEVHAQIEDEIFYTAVREATVDAPKLIDDARHAHRTIALMLDDLGRLDEESADYVQLERKLIERVRAHVTHEESAIFAEAKRGFDQADLERLGTEMEALRDDLAARPPDERRLDSVITLGN